MICVNKLFWTQNPFDSISNEELEEYKRIIDKKNRGESEVTSPVGNDDAFAEDTTDPGKIENPFSMIDDKILTLKLMINPLVPVIIWKKWIFQSSGKI